VTQKAFPNPPEYWGRRGAPGAGVLSNFSMCRTVPGSEADRDSLWAFARVKRRAWKLVGSMIKTYLTGYPWDLMNADAGAVLDRFHGEVGASGVAVWVGLGAVTRVRLPGHAPRVVQTRGGLFFQPGDAGFDATRLKPIVSTGMKSHEWLADLSGACAERGLSVRALLSCGRLGRVAQRHPEMACKNVLGGVSQRGVCLVNPDVQAFFDAVLRDLDERGLFDSMVLADTYFGWSEACDTPAPTDVPLGDTERALLSVCFCESCLQSAAVAGVDIAAARRSATVMLDSFLDAGTPADGSLATALADNEPLRQYLTWRGGALSALWRRLSESVACDVVVERAGDQAVARAAAFLDLDDSAPAAVLTGAAPGCDVAKCVVPRARRNELRIPAAMCVGDHGPELVACLSQAADAGVTAFQIEGGTTLSESGLATVKQAIRFVKRRA